MSSFENNLRSISPDERLILQCLSIFWEPITSQDFQKFVRVLELEIPDARSTSFLNLSNFRNTLIKKGFLAEIKESWGVGFQIPDQRESRSRRATASCSRHRRCEK